VRALREGRPLEDAELVERARRGDTDAYGVLVRRYQELAIRVAYLITGQAAEAEDVAQEAFVRAYYALGRFRPGTSFRAWLLRIVANEARNRRQAARRRADLMSRASGYSASGGVEPSPEAAAVANERRRALLNAVSMLNEQDRLVIAYRFFFDFSEAEMAEALGCARGTVKSRLSRALGRLRRALADLGGRESGQQELADG
jgi:RNA polymerase sigma-70 factor, ECF subfamily